MTERHPERQGAPAPGRLADEADPVAPGRAPRGEPAVEDLAAIDDLPDEDDLPAMDDLRATGRLAGGGGPNGVEEDVPADGLFVLPDESDERKVLDAAAMAGIAQLSELDFLKAERDEYLDALRRLQADFDNFRKRVRRQQEEQAVRGVESLVERLLPVLDAVDLAVAHAGDAQDALALTQVASLLHDVLAREGLDRIDTAGVAFEPAVHDAVAHVPREEPAAAPAGELEEEGAPPAGTDVAIVAEILRPGYLLKGKVLRPAMVKVSG